MPDYDKLLPGSPAAKAKGCTCSGKREVKNLRRESVGCYTVDFVSVYETDCPVHGQKALGEPHIAGFSKPSR